MRHLRLKAAAAGTCALAFLAAYGPANAFPPLAPGHGPQLLIQIEDMETEAVHENLRPNLNPKLTDQEMSEDEAAPKSKSRGLGGDDGNIEDETIDKIVPE